MKKVAETILKLIMVLTVGRTIGYFLPHIYHQGGTYLGTLAALLSNPLLTATGLIYGLSTDGERIMKRTLVILSTLLLFTVGTASAVHAGRGGLDVLNILTPEQQAKVQAYDARRDYGSGNGMRGRGRLSDH